MRERAAALETGSAEHAFAFDPAAAAAPLPQAPQLLDGSAFKSYGDLMGKAFGTTLPANVYSVAPLMYQGTSDALLAAGDDVVLPSEADGIDFEGEVVVFTTAVLMGVSPAAALKRIALAAAMAVSFPELIAYAARRRPLGAGTIVGSGTVSNDDYAQVGSACIAERRMIEFCATARHARISCVSAIACVSSYASSEAHRCVGRSISGSRPSMRRKPAAQVIARGAGTRTRMPIKTTKRKRRSIGRPADDRVGEERLIAVTVDLLKTTSPAQLNRLEIARAAGVDPALIRYYFGTKDTLLSRAVVALTQEIVAGASTHVDSEGSARVRLERYVRAFFGSVTMHPRYHELVLQQVFHGTSKHAQELRSELRRVGQAALRSIIDQGIAEGEFRDVDARFLEIALLGVSNYIVSAWPLFEDMFSAEGDRQSVVDRYLAFVVDMIFAHVSARPSPGKGARGRSKATSVPARSNVAHNGSREA